ncbi:hypothetical protein PSTT_08197, partial [Puccinia striiformis]
TSVRALDPLLCLFACPALSSDRPLFPFSNPLFPHKVDGWFQVRQEILKEATENRGAYSKLQGGEEQMRTILQDLKVKSKKVKIGGNKWLTAK